MKSTKTPRRRPLAAALAFALLAALGGLAGADDGDPVDVVFRSVNGTDGTPVVVDRFLLEEHTVLANEVAATEPGGSVFVLRGVPLVDARAYLATAWFDEVPYYWEFRGRFLDQDTNTIHVFATTDDLEGVVVSGANLIFKKSGQLTTIETILEIDNRLVPQRTIKGAPVELMIPAGAVDPEVVVHRGPSPTTPRTMRLGTNRLAIAAPLLPGKNRIRVELKAGWREGFELPFGCNLPVEAWSLLVTPETLDVVSFDLEPDPGSDLPGVARYVGPELEGGRSLTIRFEGGGPAPAAELFTEEVAGEAADTGESGASAPSRLRSVPLPLLLLAVVLVIVLLVIRRRNVSSK